MAMRSLLEGATWVIHTEKRLDIDNAQALCELFDAATEAPDQSVVIDMEDLEYISSAGLRAVVYAIRKADRQNARLALCSLSGNVQDVFRASGINQLINIHPSRPEAIAALGS